MFTDSMWVFNGQSSGKIKIHVSVLPRNISTYTKLGTQITTFFNTHGTPHCCSVCKVSEELLSSLLEAGENSVVWFMMLIISRRGVEAWGGWGGEKLQCLMECVPSAWAKTTVSSVQRDWAHCCLMAWDGQQLVRCIHTLQDCNEEERNKWVQISCIPDSIQMALQTLDPNVV